MQVQQLVENFCDEHQPLVQLYHPVLYLFQLGTELDVGPVALAFL